MTIQNEKELYRLKARLCKTFADPTRLMIIHELRSGEKTVGQIQSALRLIATGGITSPGATARAGRRQNAAAGHQHHLQPLRPQNHRGVRYGA